MNTDREETQATSPVADEHDPAGDERQPSRRNPHVDTVLTRLQEDALRFAILGVGIVAVLMNWVTVSALGTVQAADGLEFTAGKIYLLGILTLLAIEFVATKYRNGAWLLGGAFLSVVSIASLLYIQAKIDEAMASLGIFAGAVEASVGLGVYVAVVVAIAITAIGYMNGEFSVNEYLGGGDNV